MIKRRKQKIKEFLIKESNLENQFRSYLKSKGFNLVNRKKPQGVDIEAEKGKTKLVIEVEGSQKPTNEPLSTSQLYTHFFRAVGQICQRMKKGNEYRYVLLIPCHTTYIRYVNLIKEAIRRLKFYVIIKKDKHYFLVKNNGKLIKLDIKLLF